jgi:oligopeptide transport system ATP-binding protein
VPILAVEDLRVRIRDERGASQPVAGVDFSLESGEILGLVGESGCGKSLTLLALMGLLPPGAKVAGSALLGGRDLLELAPAEHRRVRGAELAMVFQDPMSSLNPYLTVGRQIAEVLEVHRCFGKADAWRRAGELLEQVHVPDASDRLHRYPHELSGGMRQRVMIAMALACEPTVLLADEPTTALDVTVQAQILALFREIRDRLGTAIVLVTHDLGVVAAVCDRIGVMYAGRMVESARADALFAAPAHPYTRGLMAAVPDPRGGVARGIPGVPPDPRRVVGGCPFEPRCVSRMDRCSAERPLPRIAPDGRTVACHLDDGP